MCIYMLLHQVSFKWNSDAVLLVIIDHQKF